MIKSAVTISLVEEARGGPFVFWDGLADGCDKAKQLGFDAIEVFPPSPEAVTQSDLAKLLPDMGLELAAVGTGAGMVKHGLSLTSPDEAERVQARDFVRSIIDCAGPFSASAIIGSMQGRWGGDIDKPTALGWLADAIHELGEHARQYNVPLIYEPLNRYETNLCNTQADGVSLLQSIGDCNATLLADLFHMNIEETSVAAGLRDGGTHVGHVHFVDSNRRAAGMGHIDFSAVAEALSEINYAGYACAEAFPYPDSYEAARQTIEAYKQFIV